MTRRLFAFVAALAMVIAACGGSGVETAAGGASEGIQVHGHWTIEVYNPDGTLDQHVQFENALVGGAAIRDLLSRTKTAGPWLVELRSIIPEDPACSGACGIRESSWTSVSSVSDNLQVQGITGGVRLSGSVVAELDGVIGRVLTFIGACLPTTAPSDCSNPEAAPPFTDKTLDPADKVTVAAGQIIQVVVDITFS